MVFEFATAGRVVFGQGKLKEIGSIAKEFGRRALFVTAGTLQRAEPALRLLRA